MSKKKRQTVVNLSDIKNLNIKLHPESVVEEKPQPQPQKKDPPPVVEKIVMQKPQRQGIVITVSKKFKAGTILPSYFIIRDLHTEDTFIATGESFESSLTVDTIVLYERDGETPKGQPRAKITEVQDVPQWAKEIAEVFSLFDTYYIGMTETQLRDRYTKGNPLDEMIKDGITPVGKVYITGEPVMLFEKTEKD